LGSAVVVAGAADVGFVAIPVVAGIVVVEEGGDPHAAGHTKLLPAAAADIDAVAAGLAVKNWEGLHR
jgi:hypothetical protein